MCFRAVKNLFKDVIAPPKTGTHHNALDDAINQTKHLQKIIQVHNLKLP
jgi:inhibitor of KinA sporulation pathway (predicted exonuclease)